MALKTVSIEWTLVCKTLDGHKESQFVGPDDQADADARGRALVGADNFVRAYRTMPSERPQSEIDSTGSLSIEADRDDWEAFVKFCKEHPDLKGHPDPADRDPEYDLCELLERGFSHYSRDQGEPVDKNCRIWTPGRGDRIVGELKSNIELFRGTNFVIARQFIAVYEDGVSDYWLTLRDVPGAGQTRYEVRKRELRLYEMGAIVMASSPEEAQRLYAEGKFSTEILPRLRDVYDGAAYLAFCSEEAVTVKEAT